MQVGEYRLFGNVASLETVRLGQAPRDSLLLGFRDAKVTVHSWDGVSLYVCVHVAVSGGV